MLLHHRGKRAEMMRFLDPCTSRSGPAQRKMVRSRPLRHNDRPLLNIVLRPSPIQSRNTSSVSVATHVCRRDIVLGGAVATGVPHPLLGDGCSLSTVESRDATRRCQTPPGTASPNAVPRRPGPPKSFAQRRTATPRQKLVRLSAFCSPRGAPSRDSGVPDPMVLSFGQPPLPFRYGHKF
jgi:hypothetical protein